MYWNPFTKFGLEYNWSTRKLDDAAAAVGGIHHSKSEKRDTTTSFNVNWHGPIVMFLCFIRRHRPRRRPPRPQPHT
ncbi:hypothetical protein FOPE_06058 [Fonsecaea pedrosoi]|nr:hypothetical protein FOPE_06058 [Fonsecaea pedrosoi]